ncbi:MAG: protein kinase [Actinomycetota bacterium]|nr:protein kinase [Actinomycetota bacterium]MDP2287348.1 protein kinase [Actinomycetota bacterium]
MTSPLDRYRMINQMLAPDSASSYWRAYDNALDREVVIRLVDASDPRAEHLNNSARAAAAVQDRRLSQILDVMEVPTDADSPDRVAVISEWIHGESLLSFMAARDWNPLDLRQAISIVTEVGQALLQAHDLRVRHGRLQPSNVLLTDSGEVRVIGMAIDSVILGAPHEDLIRSDIDALGGLLYLMLTGRSPFAVDPFGQEPSYAPAAPRHRSHLEPASHVRAEVPHELDVLLGRSMFELPRPRGASKIRNLAEFLAALAQIRADLEPVVSGPNSARVRAYAVRITVVVAVVAAIALLVVAWRQLYIGPEANPARAVPSSTQDPSPLDTATATPLGALITVLSATSFDPFGDSNRDGINDGAAGREHEQQASRAVDGNPTTSWNSLRYETANANGKGGVGLVLDLGSSQFVQSVGLTFGKAGAEVRVGVSESQLATPNAWPMLAKAAVGDNRVVLRSPSPMAGRYVLVWFPRLPATIKYPDMHQVRVSEVVVHGRG